LEEEIAVYDEVIYRFENCTELPLLEQLATALYNKGFTLGSLGRSEEAIAVFSKVARRLENHTELPLLEQLATALYNKGAILDSLGRLEEAIAVYDEVIRRLGKHTELLLLERLASAFVNKGVALGSLGRLDEAIAVYDEVITRFDNSTEPPLLEQLASAFVNKGVTLGSMGHSEEEIEVFDEVIRRLENCTELPLLERLASAFVNKGIALGRLGRLEQAEQSVRKNLEIVPTSWRANCLLASLLAFQKKWAELWNIVPALLTALEEEEASELIIDLLLQIAATGHAAKVLKIVSESEVAPDLEPLVVGLQLFLGEQPLVAQEILEIGQDVAQRIQEKQQALQNVEIVELDFGQNRGSKGMSPM
jgi:tetratricopeptide (TPR) repeat protein